MNRIILERIHGMNKQDRNRGLMNDVGGGLDVNRVGSKERTWS